MPIYEYVCRDCNHEFECLIRGDETPECASCSGFRLQRLLSVPAAHAKAGSESRCDLPTSGPCGMGGCGLPECEI